MTTEMAKAYEPSAAEAKWYPKWEERGYFEADADSEQTPYTIVIPPPNVTGMLHLGHVLNNTLQDILIRFEKMRGRNACWVPGTDHAGIATQSKVEAMLRETEQVTRHDLGREAFIERVWEWKKQYGGTIIRQLRTLGAACDWRRERFTLDEGLSNAVQDVFIRLYEKGLIYKGERMINWCPKSRTALSDEEVIPRTVKGHLWHFHYPLTDGSGQVTVATTRPETMLGDTGVAVHPEDPRYRQMIGKTVRLPIVGREIPIFGDAYVDRDFGTGAVKVTPAHDPNDYAMGNTHGLESINVMNDDGTMNAAAGAEFAGMDRYECREAVVETMQELGLLGEVREYEHNVGYSERGQVPVEPRISEQWFVKMESLAAPALEAVRDGRITFYPERYVKTYNYWLENIRDWCISRQLWWGHRIPAYTCDACGEIMVGRAMPSACSHCGHGALTQDPDVLDTWFSSWLWPFSVFGWPQRSADLDHFYPTQSLVTGPDIIFFWVARMIMAGIEFMGDIPFSRVYFTSIIRDESGRKLSKSLGNSPDPLDVIANYGADALRFTVIYIAPLGQDLRYDNKKCELGRNFANKLWNAARFRQMQGALSADWDSLDGLEQSALRPDDRWMLYRVDDAVGTITDALESFDFHGYALGLYEFVWNRFCDWYVESAKSTFYSGDESAKRRVLRVFDYAFSRILRLMHPVMPFVTEEIYHGLGYVSDSESIMNAPWPVRLDLAVRERLGLTAAYAALVEERFDLIRAGRNLRSTYNIAMATRVPYYIRPTAAPFRAMLEADPDATRVLLNASEITIDTEFAPDGHMPSAVGQHGIVYLPLEGVVDIDAEIGRLEKQQEELRRGLQGIERKLANEKFLARAPGDVVERERSRRNELAGKMGQVEELLATLRGTR